MSGNSSVLKLRFGETIPPAHQPDAIEERASATEDFCNANNMLPLKEGEPILGHGPFELLVEKQGSALGLVFSSIRNSASYTVSFSLSPLRKAIKDYDQIVASYYDAIRSGAAARIEAIDMARRGLHNEAADTLVERLEGKIAMDHETARRLFTIICALRYDGRGGLR